MTLSMKYESPPSVELFEKWLDSRQIQRHPNLSIEPMSDSSGFRIISTSSIPLGSVLCAVPKLTIFSHRTASLDLSTIPSLADEPECSADLIYRLTACLLHELRLGEDSEWDGWLQILPRETVMVPILWNEEGLAGEDGQLALPWLEGTEAEKEMIRQRDEDGISEEGLKRFYHNLVLPPTSSHPSPPTYLDFLYVFSLISSRGFMLDAYHQIGIPPFCDMFNHSSTSAHTSLLCDEDVCPICGSFQSCPHDETSDFDRLSDILPEYVERMKMNDEGDQVDMRAERDIAAGVEVFSCYEVGLTSAKALVGYGFVQAEPTPSRISWKPWDVLEKGTARPAVEILQRGRVLEEVFAGADGVAGSTKSLFKPGGTSEPGSMKFELDGDGTMSVDMFIALYLRTTNLEHYDIVDDLEDDIIRDIRAIREVAVTGDEMDEPRKDLPQVLRIEAVEAMIKLLRNRGFGGPGGRKTAAEVEKSILTLPASCPLQKQAARFSFDERSLIEDTIGRWDLILRSVSHKYEAAGTR